MLCVCVCACVSVCPSKVAQLTAQLDETQLAASNATELLEAEQLEKRQLQEQLTSLSVSHQVHSQCCLH